MKKFELNISLPKWDLLKEQYNLKNVFVKLLYEENLDELIQLLKDKYHFSYKAVLYMQDISYRNLYKCIELDYENTFIRDALYIGDNNISAHFSFYVNVEKLECLARKNLS